MGIRFGEYARLAIELPHKVRLRAMRDSNSPISLMHRQPTALKGIVVAAWKVATSHALELR